MKHKKDIGKLFGEKLADLEVEPKNASWATIEKTLRQKRRTRLGYIWFSTLLALVFLITIFNFVQEDDSVSEEKNQTSDSPISESDSQKIKQSEATQKIAYDLKENDTVYRGNENRLDQSNEVRNPKKREVNSFKNSVSHSDKNTFSTHSSTPNSRKNKEILNSRGQKEDWGTPNLEKRTEKTDKPSNHLNNPVLEFKRFGTNENDQKLSAKDHEELSRDNTNSNQDFDLSKKQLAELIKIEKDSTTKDSTRQLTVTKRKKDSSIQKTKPKEEIIKYHLFPVINSSIYANLRKTSAIDERLNANRKSAVLRTGYGGYLVFKIPPKWGIRFGLSHTAIQKNTFDVSIVPDMLNTNYYRNIDFEEGISFASFSNTFSEGSFISLEEKLAYLKFPVEVTYTVMEKSDWGVDAITGLSVSILGKNKIFATRSDGTTTLLGSNNNYSKGHFALHMGSGLYYKLNESIEIRTEALVEPRFGFLENSQKNGPILFNIQLGAVFKL